MQFISKPQAPRTEAKGFVHCPMCTHTVEGQVVVVGRNAYVKPGQKCPRCSSTLDAGYVLRLERAA
ncbi:MAG TPA: hypothetical protein DEH78_32390 [Solibacterales bacterium]|nr:hypothetical protein [Bryobacterales bacterium]